MDDGRIVDLFLARDETALRLVAERYGSRLLASNTAVFKGGVWTYEFPRDVEFQHYATPGGNDCAIAVLLPEYDSDYMSLTGYVAAGSALYELNLGAVPREKYEIALQMLHDWADALD